MRLQQPYERALYDQDLALQTRRWHVSEYEAVIGDLRPEDLRVHFFMPPALPKGLTRIRRSVTKRHICADRCLYARFGGRLRTHLHMVRWWHRALT